MKVGVLTPKATTSKEYDKVLDELHKIRMDCWTEDLDLDSMSENEFKDFCIKQNMYLVYNEFAIFASKIGRQQMYMSWDEVHTELNLSYLDDTIEHLLDQGLLCEGLIEQE